VLTTCQPSTVWCSRERLPAAAAQPAQGSSEHVAPRIFFLFSEIIAVYSENNMEPILTVCVKYRIAIG
jgi:hypothetical protein